MPVTLFLQPRASGDITLPNLNLPWYDAARGQVLAWRWPDRH